MLDTLNLIVILIERVLLIYFLLLMMVRKHRLLILILIMLMIDLLRIWLKYFLNFYLIILYLLIRGLQCHFILFLKRLIDMFRMMKMPLYLDIIFLKELLRKVENMDYFLVLFLKDLVSYLKLQYLSVVIS